MSDSIIDLAIRQQIYLEGLKANQARDLSGISEEMRNNIRGVLNSIEVENLNELNTRQLNTLLVELQAAHTAASTPYMARIMEDLQEIAAFAQGLEISQAASIETGDLPPIAFAAPAAGNAYSRALRQPINATGDLLGDFVERWPRADAMRIRKAVRVAWAQGQTAQEVVRSIVGTRSNNFADGALEVSRRHAMTVVNTSVQHVANAARQEVWENNSDVVMGYHWVATLDRRTTNQCKSLEELYGVGKDFFKTGQGPLPPIHPNCRSTTAPKLDSRYDFLDEGSTRASSGVRNQEVSGNLTYYSWLRQQPASFQNVALGRQRARLFRDGGLSSRRFAELNLDRNFKPLTLAQMREIEPEAFTAAGL